MAWLIEPVQVKLRFTWIDDVIIQYLDRTVVKDSFRVEHLIALIDPCHLLKLIISRLQQGAKVTHSDLALFIQRAWNFRPVCFVHILLYFISSCIPIFSWISLHSFGPLNFRWFVIKAMVFKILNLNIVKAILLGWANWAVIVSCLTPSRRILLHDFLDGLVEGRLSEVLLHNYFVDLMNWTKLLFLIGLNSWFRRENIIPIWLRSFIFFDYVLNISKGLLLQLIIVQVGLCFSHLIFDQLPQINCWWPCFLFNARRSACKALNFLVDLEQNILAVLW